MLADTSARFGHFREVLVAMEGRADANGLVAEIALLRAIRARVTVSCRMQAPITRSRWRCSGTVSCCPGLGSPSRSQREMKTRCA